MLLKMLPGTVTRIGGVKKAQMTQFEYSSLVFNLEMVDNLSHSLRAPSMYIYACDGQNIVGLTLTLYNLFHQMNLFNSFWKLVEINDVSVDVSAPTLPQV